MMINGVHAYDAATNNTGSSSSSSTNSVDPSEFMTLLVAEIQHQDPTQPMDPTQFMSQLVELNQLEQVTAINQVVQQFNTSTTTTGATPATH